MVAGPRNQNIFPISNFCGPCNHPNLYISHLVIPNRPHASLRFETSAEPETSGESARFNLPGARVRPAFITWVDTKVCVC
jgi:hypothetical protein